MKKFVALSLVGLFVAASIFAAPASALPPFKKAFDDKYVADSNNQAFKDAFKEASCNVCHVKGAKDKKARNEYGKALSKVIGGHAKADIEAAKASGGEDAAKAKTAEVLKKLDEAFTKTESEKSKSGQTFGEEIKAGKLP